ncbi:serine/threonine-protein phosphatase 4 regulatory subunit 1-like [Gracilinanus agilis]|uniref:serine/threonine-protein phosphatase 4 regulatory subunit 1-like n=1 Tax=Gracilinanus agilis TaxID=191870 RepID=UPI001CFD62DD|nr:serine/threonine-protein phosphatase 4 regulatory subunit 1-like [Gracilinanus agilis]
MSEGEPGLPPSLPRPPTNIPRPTKLQPPAVEERRRREALRVLPTATAPLGPLQVGAAAAAAVLREIASSPVGEPPASAATVAGVPAASPPRNHRHRCSRHLGEPRGYGRGGAPRGSLVSPPPRPQPGDRRAEAERGDGSGGFGRSSPPPGSPSGSPSLFPRPRPRFLQAHFKMAAPAVRRPWGSGLAVGPDPILPELSRLSLPQPQPQVLPAPLVISYLSWFSEIPLYFVDLQDDLDDFGFEDYGPDCDSMRITAFLDIPGQDNLTPLARLEKYAFSDNIFNRQIIARGLLDVFRDFSNNEEDFLTVMEIVVRLSEDAEPTVRTELMEQIPPIAIFLQESRPNFPLAFSEYLMPIVVRYLTDPNNQVRKSSQEVLLILLEQELIFQNDIENKVCPILLELSAPDSGDEYKAEAVNIICKMASMLSKNTVERLLLPRFCELCGDGKLFQVRKVCATNFGDVCNAVGQEATEKFLIPKFFELCSDSVWGMRKACAECFMAVSYTTSSEVRRTKLSPLFISLISDPCRWVRQAAFQSLGPFISTFANPSSAGLYIREDGTLSIRPPAQDITSTSGSMDSCVNITSSCSGNSEPTKPDPLTEGTSIETSNFLHIESSHVSGMEKRMACPASAEEELIKSCQSDSSCAIKDANDSQVNNCQGLKRAYSGSSEDIFNNFLYWRTPLPDISQDLELLQTKTEQQEEGCCIPDTVCKNCVASSEIKKVLESLQEHMMNDPDVQDISQDLELLQTKTEQQEEGCCIPDTVCKNCVASSEIKKVLESLQEHMMNDPDVQEQQNKFLNPYCITAQVQVLSAALRAAQLDSISDSETKTAQKSHEEVPNSDPRSSAENQNIISSVSSQDELFVARVIQSTDSEKHLNGTSEHLQKEQRSEHTPFEDDKSKLQDIIPQPLLDQYLSMTDPARAQTVDTDIAKHCAYSLPGVALTLGRQNWHCLKDTYETLASDVQWKVRRTLAFSIHELAVILGDQLTAADLVPIFNGFLKDLDEVRIGVLKHLYDFLKLLHADKRREYLYQLQEFVVTDNSRNWRFRYELAEQLILILELYSPNDVYDYLMHIALKLCADKVSEVRWISFKLVVAILQKFYSNNASALGLNFINELIIRFRHCPKWVGRQAFAFICQAVVREECIPVDQFVEHLLPSLLSLASDPVPNVRVLLAKALRQTLLEKAYFRNAGNPHLEVVEETVLALQSDRDQDVSFFATLEPKRNIMDTAALEKQN